MYPAKYWANHWLVNVKDCFESGQKDLAYYGWKRYEKFLAEIQDPVDYLATYMLGDQLVRKYMLPDSGESK